MVGKGAFGTVHKARWRNNFVAVKYIELEHECDTIAIEVRDLILSLNQFVHWYLRRSRVSTFTDSAIIACCT